MANRLRMAAINAIQTLHEAGYSGRRIAQLLDVDRETVAKYVAESQNRPDHPSGGAPPTGSAEENGGKACSSPPGPPSECEPFRETILVMLQQGLTAQRIYQDLVADHGFTAKYHSVRRFVAKLRATSELPVRRMEVLPGEEAQVDFGTAAPVKTPDGKTRRPWVFRIVLSHSRKAYSEAVWRQSSEAFVAALENAFRHFGGVPRTLVIDNLKAAVKKGDWYDPEIHPKLQSFGRRSVRESPRPRPAARNRPPRPLRNASPVPCVWGWLRSRRQIVPCVWGWLRSR
ncbi:MAG: IS21 family transposase [Planctomycetota bacterium]|nr:MAG: IS21 family transposase [Planctomycetota bacterium]